MSTTTITLRIPLRVLEAVEREAETRGLTKNALMAQMIEAAVGLGQPSALTLSRAALLARELRVTPESLADALQTWAEGNEGPEAAQAAWQEVQDLAADGDPWARAALRRAARDPYWLTDGGE